MNRICFEPPEEATGFFRHQSESLVLAQYWPSSLACCPRSRSGPNLTCMSSFGPNWKYPSRFASLALDSRTKETRQRRRRNARKAYDTSVRFWNKYRFGEPTAQRNLLAQLTTLRHLFLQLRETFEE